MTAPLTLSDGCTGLQAADAIRAFAHREQLPITIVLTRLGILSTGRLNEMAVAARLRPDTVSRIQALLAGAPIPPVRRYGNPKPVRPPPALTTASGAVRSQNIVIGAVTAHDRSPCARCGIRADLGCRHRRPSQPERIEA